MTTTNTETSTPQLSPLGIPTTPTDPATVDGAALLDQVKAVLTTYVIFPSEAALIAVVLWIASTHIVPAWNCAPRLVIRAPEKRCGKSRLLDIIEALCHNPLMTTNASPSAVYRSIGANPDNPPTLLIDESDTIFGPKASDNEDLRGLLNAGHGRGRPALRYDASAKTVEKVPTFAMAALAGIGVMPDTIEDRAIIIRMRRRAPGENVAPYRVRRDAPPLADLKNRLHAWTHQHIDTLTSAEPTMPVEDRAADTWEPLVAIADLAGGNWPHAARRAILDLQTDKENASEVPFKIRLLIDCRTAFTTTTALRTETLIERLTADPEAPWADLKGKPITPRTLALILKEYDIKPANHRWDDGTQTKGYTAESFTDAWNRYCPPPELDPTPLEPLTCRICNQPLPQSDHTGTHPSCTPHP